MRHLINVRSVFAGVFALGLLAAACSNGSNSSAGAGGDTFSIASPADGAKVGEPFTLKVNSSAALGDPSTGDDHVHLCFDGASCDSEYQLVYSDTFQVDGLAPGQHTIEASLRHADHSAVGPTATITVTVTGGAGGSTVPPTSLSPTPTATPTRGYGY